MRNPTAIACAVIALALFATTAYAETYRWVDQNGRVHYTDTPPPPTATQGEEKKLSSNVVQSDSLSYSAQVAAKNFPVTLYTGANCGQPCNDARNLLVKRGVPFKEISVGDEKSREALKRASGSLDIPVLAVGQDVRKGYLQSMWHAALDGAGYPKSGPVGAKKRGLPTESAAAGSEPKPVPGPYTPRF